MARASFRYLFPTHPMPSRLPFPAVPRRLLPLLRVLLCALAVAAPAHAQRLTSGTLRGEVLDAESAAPLAGATVALTPASPTVVMPPRERSAFLSAARTTTTGADGRYAFGDLAPGAYVLRVHRMGYRAATLEVSLAAPSEARVSVGLTMAPVLLQAMEVRTPAVSAADTTGTRRMREAEDARLAAARARQARYLSTDARELTRADVDEAVTLGESDLLRAFQRLPGVTTRDDYSSELWVRGARWDLTRITLDGLPLYAPFHNAGLLTALPADAVDAATLLPGVRPASLGGGAAALVDLRTRAGGGDGALRGTGDLNVFGAGASLDQRRRDGRLAWMAAGRGGFATPLLAGAELPASVEVMGERNQHFADLAGRVDVALGRGARLEASAFSSRDGVVAVAPPFDTARFGTGATTALARVTLVAPLGRVLVRQSAGVSRWDQARHGWMFLNADTLTYRAADGIHFATLDGELAPRDGRAWRAGWALSRERATTSATTDEYANTDALVTGSLWAQNRWAIAPRLTLDAGLRTDVGTPLANAAAVRPMPRLELRFALDSGTFLSAAVGRAFQYAQARGAYEAADGETLRSGAVRWLVADDSIPAVRADVATLGAERWLGAGWLASGTVYLRRSTGLVMQDRRPGTVDERYGLFVGSERARGLELGVRKLTGRLTGQLGGALAESRTKTQGLEFASNQDHRYALDATAMWRAWRGLRVGTAYTRVIGTPNTRRVFGVVAWDSVTQTGTQISPSVQDTANAFRARYYESADLLADWRIGKGRLQFDAYAQVRNVFRRRNDAEYVATVCSVDDGRGTLDCTDPRVPFFAEGWRFLPVFGIRLRF